jgi:HD superfamily phosphohydrolase YqeK
MTSPDIVADAAHGTLPAWACCSPSRIEHMKRVAELMATWARDLGLSSPEIERWTAAGLLHDALKGVDPLDLRTALGDEARGVPDPVLHGPAVARRLAAEGLDDAAFLLAVGHHTLGHPDFDRLGCCLYAADFLEPGRDLRNEWRASLRARMPDDWRGVVREITGARIEHLIRRERRVHDQTVRFWNAQVGAA